jgi:hypothetical protein
VRPSSRRPRVGAAVPDTIDGVVAAVMLTPSTSSWPST